MRTAVSAPPPHAASRTLMITLAWGNFLAIVLPGMIVMFAVRRYVPTLDGLMTSLVADPTKITAYVGVFLLMIAALAGAVIDGLRRVMFEGVLVCMREVFRGPPNPDAPQPTPPPTAPTPAPNRYAYITPYNQALFEMLVEQSWRYYAFYGNLFWALMVLIVARLAAHPFDLLDACLTFTAIIVAAAAYLQFGMFGDAMDGFIEGEQQRRKEPSPNADKPTA